MEFKILIVEDEDEVRTLLVSIVESLFVKEYSCITLSIETAQNGAEALQIAKQERQDLILTDIIMPQMDGLELIRRVRYFDKSVPILVLSALSSEVDIAKIMQSGATNYSAKPLNRKLFTAQIKVFVDFFLRRQQHYNYKATNLFSKKVYRRKVEFYIERENDLLEFWEYMIRAGIDIENINIVLQYIYEIEYLLIKRGIANTIILEENDNEYFFTLLHLSQLESQALEELYAKYKLDALNHRSDGNLDSFRVAKVRDEKTLEAKREEQQQNDKKVVPIVCENPEDTLECFLDELSAVNVALYNLEESALIQEAKEQLGIVQQHFRNFQANLETMQLHYSSEAFVSLIDFLGAIDKRVIQNYEQRILLAQMLTALMNDLEEWMVEYYVEKDASDQHYFDGMFADNTLAILQTFQPNS